MMNSAASILNSCPIVTYENKIGEWIYGDYKISLYDSKGSLHAKVKNAEGGILPSHLSLGVLGNRSHADFDLISSSAQISAFPYLKQGKLAEIWVFEAIPSAAPSIYRARKTLKSPQRKGLKKL